MDGFCDSEKEARKPAVYANVFQNISMLLAGIEQLNLPLPVDNQVSYDYFCEYCLVQKSRKFKILHNTFCVWKKIG